MGSLKTVRTTPRAVGSLGEGTGEASDAEHMFVDA